jgi:hypothetical protein
MQHPPDRGLHEVESLLVHWRRKDEAAFAAIRDAINARILR